MICKVVKKAVSLKIGNLESEVVQKQLLITLQTGILRVYVF
jgi:hypothetical protein